MQKSMSWPLQLLYYFF